MDAGRRTTGAFFRTWKSYEYDESGYCNQDNQEAEEGSSEPTDEELYDPYLHRAVYKPMSDFGSLANLTKSAAGTGLFAMPNAFACVGLFFGVVGTALVGLLITGCLRLIVKIHHFMCARLKRPVLRYDEVVVAALTTSAPLKPWLSARVLTVVVDVTMLTCYIGIGSVYIVFISDTMQECVGRERAIGQSYYVLVIFPFLFLMNTPKNLSDFTPISVAGNVLLLAAGTVGVVYALKDEMDDTWLAIEPNVNLYPKFIGTVFFSMCSTPGVMLAIEHNMRKPWNYTKPCGILNWSMTLLVLLHVFVGVIGYLKWGSKALGNFIRNHPENDGPTITALAMQALAIYFTYGLQCYVPITILKNNYVMPAIRDGKGSPFLWDLITRFFVTFLTSILAAANPKLDLFLGLMGAICISILATLTPAILYIVVHHENYGKYKWRLVVGVFMFSAVLILVASNVVTNIRL